MKIYNIFTLPSLFLHELSHLIIMVLTLNIHQLYKIDIKITKNFATVGVILRRYEMTPFFLTEFLIASSPILLFILFVILSFYYPIFIYIVIYQILAFKTTLPSSNDVSMMEYRRFKSFKKNGLDYFVRSYIEEFGENDEESIRLKEEYKIILNYWSKKRGT